MTVTAMTDTTVQMITLTATTVMMPATAPMTITTTIPSLPTAFSVRHVEERPSR